MVKKKKLLIFLPAYCAAKTICKVLDRIPKKTFDRATEILVLDNHSPDGTFEAVKRYKKRKKIAKLKVFRHKRNLGFGGNVKAACKYAKKRGMDIIAVLHSDGQYPSEKILELIKPIEQGKANAVSGSRFLEDPRKGGMPYWRYAGNIFLTKIENSLIGHKMSEWHSGFRAYDVQTLKQVPFHLCVEGYEWTTDILLLIHTLGGKVAEISIPTHYGEDSTSPSMKRTFTYFVNSFMLAWAFYLNKKGIRKVPKYSFKTMMKRKSKKTKKSR